MPLVENRFLEMNVVDNLESTSNYDSLSANMGRFLNETKLPRELESFSLVVSESGVDNGDISTAFRTIEGAFDSLPDICRNCVVKIGSGTYNPGSFSWWKYAFSLIIESQSGENDVTFQGNNLSFKIGGPRKVEVKNISFSSPQNEENSLEINGVPYFIIENCYFSNCFNAIYSESSSGTAKSCRFSQVSNAAIYASISSTFLVDSCVSSSNINMGVVSNGSVVINYGKQLTADITYLGLRNGRVFGFDTDDEEIATIMAADISELTTEDLNSADVTSGGNIDTDTAETLNQVGVADSGSLDELM